MTREREPGTREDEREHRFGVGDPFSIGVEEELFLVNPDTGRQANASTAVLERLGEIERHRRARAARLPDRADHRRPRQRRLRDRPARRRCDGRSCETGAGLLGSGTHPTGSKETPRRPTRSATSGSATCWATPSITPVGGLHVHVGMPDAETAISAFNELRRHLPLLQALAANSPFRHGRDTGLASAREITIRGWPRSGVPRAMRDYDDFRELSTLLARRRRRRLHVVLVEAAPASRVWARSRCAASTRRRRCRTRRAIIALIHCLARDAAEAPAGRRRPAGRAARGRHLPRRALRRRRQPAGP